MTFPSKLTLGLAAAAALAFTTSVQARDHGGHHYSRGFLVRWLGFDDRDLVTNRKLYSPKEGEGHFTNLWYDYHEKEGIFGVSNSFHEPPKPGPDEGIFGISSSRRNPLTTPGPDEGLFGISHPPRQ